MVPCEEQRDEGGTVREEQREEGKKEKAEGTAACWPWSLTVELTRQRREAASGGGARA